MTTALPVLVVRNTFLDIEEDAAEAEGSCKRSSSAPRSWKPEAREDSPIASTAASSAGSDDETDSGQVSDSTRSSGQASGPAWADAEGDSDEEFFAKMPRRWTSPQWCSKPFHAEAPEYDAAPHQAALLRPPRVSLPLSLPISAEQQAASAIALPVAAVTQSARTPLRTKLSGAARSFNPSTASSMVTMVPPYSIQAPPASLEAPPAPAAPPAPPPLPRASPASASATLVAPGHKFRDLLPPADLRASRRASGTKASRNRRQFQQQQENHLPLKKERKQATGCVGSAVGAAISKTEGVASVAVSKGVNETTFTVHVKPGHQEAADAVLRAAKAAVMNASALSTGTYVIGYLKQPFEESPRGFTASLGFVHQYDEDSACWGFYENGSCPCRSVCCKQHPKEENLERISVIVLS